MALLTLLPAIAQTVQRNKVIVEIGTGTWCQYCPGAAMGADDLIANGCQVAVIENHNGDTYANNYSNARNTYYNITGYPTAFFDGTLNVIGGDHSVSMYPSYLPLYQQRYAVASPLTIDISGTSSGNVYTVTLTIHKVAAITATDIRTHLVLTESNILENWQGQTHLNYVNRIMVPDENGTTTSFANGDMVVMNLTFTRDAAWVLNNLELVVFVQDQATKEIFNGAKVALTALPLPMSVNFTGSPNNGCAPLNVNFTDQSTGATNWQWTFPGGTPATSGLQNPAVVYNTPGSHDVTLTAWNNTTGRGGIMTKSAFITLNTTPATPGMPQGTAGMCQNPGTITYSVTPVSGATSYTWELSPVSAGTLSPNGASCSVAWSSSFLGNATLKVQCSNACGTSSWSPLLQATISQQPAQPAPPSGPGELCMDAPNTDYTVTPVTPATSYGWDLVPADAGALYPSGTTCTIDWVATWSGAATLKVKAINNSCDGPWSNTIPIMIHPEPAAFNLTGGGAYCGQGGSGSPVGLDGSQSGTSYTLYFNGTATSTVVPGTGSAISFGNQTGAGSYTAVASFSTLSCTNPMNGAAVVTIDPQVPNVPGDPMGPTQVYTGATPTTDFTTIGGTYSTTYTWDLSPATAGSFNGSTTTGTVTWDDTYVGTAVIRVKGVNSCGGGSFSNEFPVSVDVGVGIAEPGQVRLVSLYPNPAKGMVTIIPARSITADILVYNPIGTIVLNKPGTVLGNNYQMDISNLKSGVYLVRINAGDMRQTIKMIVE